MSPIRNAMVFLAYLAIALSAVVVGRFSTTADLFYTMAADRWPLWYSHPVWELAAHQIRDGHLPLWNPLNGLGHPLLGAYQGAFFHPGRIIGLVIPFLPWADIYVVGRLIFAATGAYVLAAEEGLNAWGRRVAGVAWGATGFLVMYMPEPLLDGTVMLPWVCWTASRLARRKRRRDLLLLAGAVALVLLSGHPSAIFYIMLVGFLYALFGTAHQARCAIFPDRLRLTTAAYALGALLAVAALLPFGELLARSWNYHPEGYGAIHVAANNIPGLISPLFYSAPAPSGLHSPQNPPYVGFWALAFACTALILRRYARGAIAWWTVTAVVLGGVAFGLPPFTVLYDAPGFDRVSNFRVPFQGVALAVAMLAGAGAHVVSSGRLDSPRARQAFDKIPATVLLAVLTLGLAAELAFNFTHTIADVEIRRPVMVRVPADNEAVHANRIIARDDFARPNFNLHTRMADFRLLEAVYDARYRRIIDLINGHSRAQGDAYFFPFNYLQIRGDRLDSPLLPAFGVRWLISPAPAPEHTPPHPYFPTDWKPVKEWPWEETQSHMPDTYTYVHPDTLPRVYSVPAVVPVVTDTEALGILPSLDFSKSALVSTSLPSPIAGLGTPGLDVEPGWDRLRITHADAATDRAPSFLVINDLHYPGWKAYVDGVETRVLRTNYLVRGIVTESGWRRVTLRFEPVSFRIGLWVSLTSVLPAGVLALGVRRRGRPRPS